MALRPYCEIFTIGNADCLVMKKNWQMGRLPKPRPIVEIFQIDFSIGLNFTLFVNFATINPFLTKPWENLILS